MNKEDAIGWIKAIVGALLIVTVVAGAVWIWEFKEKINFDTNPSRMDDYMTRMYVNATPSHPDIVNITAQLISNRTGILIDTQTIPVNTSEPKDITFIFKEGYIKITIKKDDVKELRDGDII